MMREMKLRIKIFTRKGCDQCLPARALAERVAVEYGVEVKHFDVDDLYGKAEAMFHQVLSTPSCIVVDMDNNELEVHGWRAVVPNDAEMRGVITSILKNETFNSSED